MDQFLKQYKLICDESNKKETNQFRVLDATIAIIIIRTQNIYTDTFAWPKI